MKPITKIKKIFVGLTTTLPIIALGQIFTPPAPQPGKISGILATIQQIMDGVLIVIMIIATIVFIWGVISYILAVGSDERKKEAKNLIIWGLIGLFVIVAIWGLVRVIAVTFGVGSPGTPSGPGELPFQ